MAASVASREAVRVVASRPVVPKRAWVRAAWRTASGRPVHEVGPAAAVDVHIQKARQDPVAGGVQVAGARGRHAARRDFGDAARVVHHQRPACQNTLRRDDLPRDREHKHTVRGGAFGVLPARGYNEPPNALESTFP